MYTIYYYIGLDFSMFRVTCQTLKAIDFALSISVYSRLRVEWFLFVGSVETTA